MQKSKQSQPQVVLPQQQAQVLQLHDANLNERPGPLMLPPQSFGGTPAQILLHGGGGQQQQQQIIVPQQGAPSVYFAAARPVGSHQPLQAAQLAYYPSQQLAYYP